MSLEDVRKRIEEVVQAANRAESQALHVKEPTLIAVSKLILAEKITPVLEAGQQDFGENRVQEAQNKWPQLQEEYPNVRLHLLGPLQTNKTALALKIFDVIHSLDRLKLAQSIAKERDKLEGQCPDLFIQVNTGLEEQKAGITPNQLKEFIDQCRSLDLPIIGLMCIPPVDHPPAPHFAFLRKLGDEHSLDQFSMGMSGDYPEAIALGSTHVRVGTAIFGTRAYHA